MNRSQALKGSSAIGLTAAALVCAGTVLKPASAADQSVPQTLQLTGKVRDFIEKSQPNGHPDFEKQPSGGFGLYNGNIDPVLGADKRPVFKGGGWKTTSQWKDKNGKQICYTLYDSSKGDVKGTKSGSDTGGITNGASFVKWFDDVPGTNMSAPLTITLTKGSDGSYVFDDKLDPVYSSKGGFFPIDDQLFGNSAGTPKHNYHFTFELHCEFAYKKGTGQMFKFIGDDDVFVFINKKLVIDLGGVHSEETQYVDLDRLGLTDGQTYPLDFFYAERHRTKANCRIQTNLLLSTPNAPNVTSAFD